MLGLLVFTTSLHYLSSYSFFIMTYVLLLLGTFEFLSSRYSGFCPNLDRYISDDFG